MHHSSLRSGKCGILCSLSVATLLAFACHTAWALSFGTVAPASLQAWKAFRAAQPFQAQVIGVTGSPADAQRTLIISEPPPSLSWARIQQLLGASVAGCETRAWSIMSGGWVSDVVCTLKPVDAARGAELLAQLQVDVYGSAEGAPVVALPAPRRKMIAHSLDLRYSANDLHTWLVKANPMLRGSPLVPALPLKDLLNQDARGVFRAHAKIK